MSATLFKKVDYSLSKLIHDIDQGEIGLPDIQRPFVWETAKVRIDSETGCILVPRPGGRR